MFQRRTKTADRKASLTGTVLITSSRAVNSQSPLQPPSGQGDLRNDIKEGAGEFESPATSAMSRNSADRKDSRQGSATKKVSQPSVLNSSSKSVQESKQLLPSKPNVTGSSRPQKVYSSSKFNDTRSSATKAKNDNKQQFRNALAESRRSHLKTPPRVPVIVCDEFQEDISPDRGSPSAQGAEKSEELPSDTHNLDEYQTFVSNFHFKNEESETGEVPWRASSTKSSSRGRHQEPVKRRESYGGSVSHWGSFELSSEDEKCSSVFNDVDDFPSQRSPTLSEAFMQEQKLAESPRNLSKSPFFVSGKEIGEAVEDADFDSDEDKNQEATENDIKTLYERACRLVGVVSSKRIERELLSNRVDLDYAGLLTADIKAISIALLNNTTVSRLDLSGNDLCHQAAQYISELLNENNYITHLFLASCQLRERATDSIISSVTGSRSIRVIDLSENKLHDDHLKMLASLIKNNGSIRELRLRYCDIDAEGGHILAPALAETTIEKLDLSWNQLRQRGGAEFCLALGQNSSIRELDLSWNGLGREGCSALEVSLAKNKSLIQLNLECNRITSECLAHLLKGMERNKTLESIILTKNPISTDDAKMITTALTNMTKSAIKVFDISDVTVDNEFIKDQERLQSDRHISIYHGNLLHRPEKEVKQGPRTLSSFDPILVLFEYMKQQNLRLIDLFRNLDLNHDNAISKEELRNGFLSLKMNLPEGVLSAAFNKLDLNSNNQIDIDELKNAHRRVLRQTAMLMARSNTNDGDESYGDLLHEFRRMVRVATMFRRRTKPSTEDPPQEYHKNSRPSSSILAPENIISRRPTKSASSGRASFSNNLDPNDSSQGKGKRSWSPRRSSSSSTTGQTQSRRLSSSPASSGNGSDRSLSPG